MKLAGRSALITGASRGLGVAIAERYLAEGASLFLCAREEQALVDVRDKLEPLLREGQQLFIRPANVSDARQVADLIDEAVRRMPQLDTVVNNAGVYGPLGQLEDVDWAAWVETIAINLLGTAAICRAIVPHLKRRRYGKIINLSGGGATNPLPRLSAYAASKAAIVRFTETLAEEVRAFRIDVNAIAPGALATRLMDQVVAAGPEAVGDEFHARMVKLRADGGTPLETPAALCAYLASSESDGITGKLVAAVWDPWPDFQKYRRDLEDTDIYTLRRIVPKDRGKAWGDR